MTRGGGGSSLDGDPDVGPLRRCLSDVVALSTLGAVWAGAPRLKIAEGLAEVARETLGADVVFVGLRATSAVAACEHVAVGRPDHEPLAATIRAGLAPWLCGRDATPAMPDLGVPSTPLLVTPIGIHAEHGVVVAASSRSGFPSDTERLLLNVAANQATLALLSERARDEQRIADTLQRIGTAVAAELDPEKVIQAVTDETTTLTGADFGAFFYNVANGAGESYMLFTLSGASRDAFSRFPMPRNTAVFAPTFAGTGVVRSSDITQDLRFGQNAPYYGMPPGHLPVRSYLAVPVVSRTGKVHGGLFLGHKDSGMFAERHERLAVGVAAWAALAMDNGYLYGEAQRANMAKDQFLATLSHELRTPLNAIVGWLSMLRRPEVMTAAGVPKAWATIDRNTQALNELIEDLLDVSRIATGKIRLAIVDVDLTDLVRDSVRTMEPKFAEKNVSLAVDLCAEPCRVRGDAARLRQVTGNLLSNAVKFTAAGGRVEVRLTSEDTAVVLVVSDTGIGIHPDFLPHVFEQFRQGEVGSATGLGLGLAIVKNLIVQHGGTVDAASEGIGRGARFTVRLPRMVSGS